MGFMGGGKNSGSKQADQARRDEQERQARIREGTGKIDNIFGQFDDNFYDDRRDAYLNYATPQLDDQYGDAQRELTFSLARSGLLDSSARGEKTGELQKLYDLNRQQITDQALSSANEARNAVENARSDLVGQLNATGDAQGIANSALARASALSKPAAYSPLTQLFASFTQGIGQQAALERANYYSGGAVKPKYSTGLFTPSNTVEVTG